MAFETDLHKIPFLFSVTSLKIAEVAQLWSFPLKEKKVVHKGGGNNVTLLPCCPLQNLLQPVCWPAGHAEYYKKWSGRKRRG